MRLINFKYPGVLPKKLENPLIKEGKRMGNVPQMPFGNQVAPKIERKNAARRLSPSMNRKHTFLTHSDLGISNFNSAASLYPMPGNMTPAPFHYGYDDFGLPYGYSADGKPIVPRYKMEPQQPSGVLDPYAIEKRKKAKLNLQARNNAVNISREARGWLSTGNNSIREARSTLKYLKVPGDKFFE